jgi:acyl dehydratase
MISEVYRPDEIYVGRDFGGFDFDITPASIENYIAGTGDHNSWYTTESPVGNSIAPALILHSAVFRRHDWYLPNIFGNLHARQEWQGFGLIHPGDKLHSRCVIVDRYVRRDREYVVNECLILSTEGRILQRSRTHQSFVMTSATGGNGFAVDRSREKSGGRVFNVGQRGGEPIATSMRTVSQAMCMAFSGPGRNYHTDTEEAHKLGFPEIVVQGMLSVCLIGELMTRRFGLGFIVGGRFDLRLVNVLWAEETTCARGRVLECHPEGERTRAEVEVWCEKADGTITIVGTASALEL